MPQNSLRHADFFHLEQYGAPKMRSFVVASISALVRSSLKTITNWPQWISQLEEAADQFLPLRPMVKKTLTPSHWDSPPIALNLSEASKGMPNDRLWADFLPNLVQQLKGSGPLNGPIQKHIYKKIMHAKFSDCLNHTIEVRLTKLFHPFQVDLINSISLSRCAGILKKCRVAEVIKMLKCWTNGWATSRRYNSSEEKVLPCLFGCPSADDDLAHYVQCPHLYALWKYLIDPLFEGGVSEFPLERWGLIEPSNFKFRSMACVYAGYHAVRREFKDRGTHFEHSQNILTGHQLALSWRVFAEAFCVNARELSINTRKFSLPDFLAFLQHGSDQLFNQSSQST